MAVWRAEHRTATCMPCVEGATVDGADAGVAGGSARQEGDRRREAQQARDGAPVDTRVWKRITRGGRDRPDAGARWIKGAAGEERLGSLLDRLADDGTIAVIHDRALPHSSANLDHLAVAAAGVWVIDAKSYRGRVEVIDKGTPARPDPRLVVDGRDRTPQLVQGSRWQANQVRRALDPTYRDVPVRQAVCFVDAKRRLGSKARMIDDTLVTWEKDIVRRLREQGSLDERFRNAIQHHLATRLRPATGRSG